MKDLSKKLLAIKPSQTVLIDSRAKQLIAKGVDIINLGSGEPEGDTSDRIKNAGIAAIKKGLTKYSSPTGLKELKEAVVTKLKRENNCTYTQQQIVISSGAKHAIYNALSALINPGDEVIIPVPYWVTYPSLVELLGGVPVYIQGDPNNGLKVTAAQVNAACTIKTKCIMLNSPCNPTGSIFTPAELIDIGDVILKNDLYCITDEIYEHLIYDGSAITTISSLNQYIADRTIFVNGISKAYAMTGYRIGYTASSIEISKVIGAFQSQSTHHPSMPAQYAAVEALNQGMNFTQDLKISLKVKMDLAEKLLLTCPAIKFNLPQGAFYFFLDMHDIINKSKTIHNSGELCEYLLTEHKVATVPGSAFGLENYLRFSFTTSLENLEKGVKRIITGVNELVGVLV